MDLQELFLDIVFLVHRDAIVLVLGEELAGELSGAVLEFAKLILGSDLGSWPLRGRGPHREEGRQWQQQ